MRVMRGRPGHRCARAPQHMPAAGEDGPRLDRFRVPCKATVRPAPSDIRPEKPEGRRSPAPRLSRSAARLAVAGASGAATAGPGPPNYRFSSKARVAAVRAASQSPRDPRPQVVEELGQPRHAASAPQLNGRPSRPASGPGPFPHLGFGGRASSLLRSGFAPRGRARPRRRDRSRAGSPRPARARSH
jgi:hypothetical protein